MSRASGKRTAAALAMYAYLLAIPEGKQVVIRKVEGALWFKIEDRNEDPQITFTALDEETPVWPIQTT